MAGTDRRRADRAVPSRCDVAHCRRRRLHRCGEGEGRADRRCPTRAKRRSSRRTRQLTGPSSGHAGWLDSPRRSRRGVSGGGVGARRRDGSGLAERTTRDSGRGVLHRIVGDRVGTGRSARGGPIPGVGRAVWLRRRGIRPPPRRFRDRRRRHRRRARRRQPDLPLRHRPAGPGLHAACADRRPRRPLSVARSETYPPTRSGSWP